MSRLLLQVCRQSQLPYTGHGKLDWVVACQLVHCLGGRHLRPDMLCNTELRVHSGRPTHGTIADLLVIRA